MKRIELLISTDGSGNATTTGPAIAGGGLLWAVVYKPGTIDTGATVTLTDNVDGQSFTLWSKASAGTSTIRKYPRVLMQLNTDGSDITGQYVPPAINGYPKVVVSSGASTKAGSIVLYILEA